MSDGDKTLLPPTATGLARALDMLEERLFRLPVQMITKDPWKVDAKLLDHLAWEHSVDVWDEAWPEDIKRNVIAISAEVHRYKGTPYGIRAALSAFDVDTDLIEWWHPEGVADGLEPGSFRVTAYAGRSLYSDTESSIDLKMLGAMNAVVLRVAPVSRKLVFRLGERFEAAGGFQAAVLPVHLHRSDLQPRSRPALVEASAGVQAGVRSRLRSSEIHVPQPRPTEAAVPVTLGAGVRASVISRETHDILRRAAV